MQSIRKRILNKCAKGEKMLKLKKGYVMIIPQRKLIRKNSRDKYEDFWKLIRKGVKE